MKTLNFSEIRELLKALPPKKMLWNGVKEKSFGIVFGPSKSGKTMFCENLAISIAVGKPEFFEYQLDGVPKRVLFIGLEESWENRAERNFAQFDTLTNAEQELMNINYKSQPVDFTKSIHNEADWENLSTIIQESEAEIVFIDSITRLMPGKMEDSGPAEKMMLKLRSISQELDITLFAIHHTPKLYNNAITMDSIKGSSVFAQESDFAIGISRTDRKNRYMKNVFFRYAKDDDDEFVKEFSISDNAWLEIVGNVDEDEILNRVDRRRAVDKLDIVQSYFTKNPSVSYTLQEVVDALKPKTGLKERQIKSHLSTLASANRIANPERGVYKASTQNSTAEGGKNV